MENSTKNIEIIDRLLENQRRSRLWTIVSVAVFVVMALFILFYSKQLAKTRGKLTVSEQKLQDANRELEAKNKTLDSLNHLLAQLSDSVITENTGLALSLDQNKAVSDSINSIKDTITVLLNRSLQQISDQGQGTSEKISELYQQAFPGTAKVPSRDIMEQIAKTNVIEEPQRLPAIVAVRYMPEYAGVAQDIFARYSNRTAVVKPPVELKEGNFNPVVKYYSDKDKMMAERLARKLNEEYGQKFSRPFEVQWVERRNTSHYFEVWLGKYTMPEYNKLQQQLIRKSFSKFQ